MFQEPLDRNTRPMHFIFVFKFLWRYYTSVFFFAQDHMRKIWIQDNPLHLQILLPPTIGLDQICSTLTSKMFNKLLNGLGVEALSSSQCLILNHDPKNHISLHAQCGNSLDMEEIFLDFILRHAWGNHFYDTWATQRMVNSHHRNSSHTMKNKA